MSESGPSGPGVESDSLVFQGRLPAAFKAIADIPSVSTLAINNERNEHTLRSSLIPNESVETDDNDDISQHLKRQEAKIDLLMDMVAELLARQSHMPKDVEVKLTAQDVVWQDSEQQFAVDECVEVDIYITPSTPKAIRFYGRIASSAEGEHRAEFAGVSRQVSDLLEKIIFRHHRRAVAQQRSGR